MSFYTLFQSFAVYISTIIISKKFYNNNFISLLQSKILSLRCFNYPLKSYIVYVTGLATYVTEVNDILLKNLQIQCIFWVFFSTTVRIYVIIYNCTQQFLFFLISNQVVKLLSYHISLSLLMLWFITIILITQTQTTPWIEYGKF